MEVLDTNMPTARFFDEGVHGVSFMMVLGSENNSNIKSLQLA